MARNCSISPRVVARQAGACAERGLFEKAVRDLADRTAADRRDAGDREQVRDQRMRGLRVGARHRGEHALIFRALVRGGADQLVEIVRKTSRAVEVLHETAAPGGREVERLDQRGEQADVAHPHVRRGHAVMRGGLEPERQHLGVGGGGVAAAEASRCRPAGIPPRRLAR